MKALKGYGESWQGSKCLFLKSLRTHWNLIKLELVSGVLEKPNEPSKKLLLWSNLWNPVKNINFLYDPLWSLEGYWGSWKSLGSSHKKFRQNRTTGSILNGQFKWSLKFKVYWRLFLGSRTPLINFCWIQKLSFPPHNIHGERWCIKKILTSLISKRFFLYPVNVYSHPW